MSTAQFSRPQGVVKKERRKQPLGNSVQTALENYFVDIDGHQASDLYRLVIGEVEQAMLRCVMDHVRGNQTHAAEVLGINRSTLRKKLRLHDLD